MHSRCIARPGQRRPVAKNDLVRLGLNKFSQEGALEEARLAAENDFVQSPLLVTAFDGAVGKYV